MKKKHQVAIESANARCAGDGRAGRRGTDADLEDMEKRLNRLRRNLRKPKNNVGATRLEFETGLPLDPIETAQGVRR